MLNWETDGLDWPNRKASRFVVAGGLRWHVQFMGKGPVALLLHGTGASTHSWRDFAPLLARHFTIVAPDLPGHAFTERPKAPGLSLPGIAASVRDLLDVLEMEPVFGIGHSAGAAILARMTIDGALQPRALVSLNGALLPFRGVPASCSRRLRSCWPRAPGFRNCWPGARPIAPPCSG
jgi:magnesium chelatase accessory protein